MNQNGSTDNPELAAAFGAGCDARIAGIPKAFNPHSEGRLRVWWARGHDDAASYWGCWARWPVKPLPKVRVVA